MKQHVKDVHKIVSGQSKHNPRWVFILLGKLMTQKSPVHSAIRSFQTSGAWNDTEISRMFTRCQWWKQTQSSLSLHPAGRADDTEKPCAQDASAGSKHNSHWAIQSWSQKASNKFCRCLFRGARWLKTCIWQIADNKPTWIYGSILHKNDQDLHVSGIHV